MKGNVQRLAEIGLSTRFGPDWPGKRCLAKTRRSRECQRPAITGSGRCRLHGGRSTGPRTQEGRALIAAANTKHGQRTNAKLVERRERARVHREIDYVLRSRIALMIEQGFLPKGWRP
jgi:hypothetical protein